MNDLCETDFLQWTERQSTLLRRRAAGKFVNDGEVDWLNLAEEIETVGASTRRELRNRFVRLLQHLLKWQCQPALRSRSRQATIVEQREELAGLLADNPSLHARLPAILPHACARGHRWALTETGLLDLPETSPFSVQHVLGEDLPG